MPSQLKSAQQMMDAGLHQEQDSEVVRALGWLFMLFDTIPAVWIWVGLRSGSRFWLWWTLAEGVAALAAIIIAGRMKSHAMRLINRGLEEKAAEEQAKKAEGQPRLAA